jgi:hypothetical protein
MFSQLYEWKHIFSIKMKTALLKVSGELPLNTKVQV